MLRQLFPVQVDSSQWNFSWERLLKGNGEWSDGTAGKTCQVYHSGAVAGHGGVLMVGGGMVRAVGQVGEGRG